MKIVSALQSQDDPAVTTQSVELADALAEFYHDNTCLTPETAGEFAKRMVIAPLQGRPKHYATYSNIKLKPGLFWRWGLRRLSYSLQRRTSGREFSKRSLPLRALARLLLGALEPGAQRAEGLRQRPYPSAGGLYAVNVFLVALRVEGICTGVYNVNADQQKLQQVCLFDSPGSLQAIISQAILADGDSRLRNSQALLIFTGDFSKVKQKYGDRAYRFLLLEAGHIAQNIALCATALGLLQVPLGGFCEGILEQALIKDPALHVLYVMNIGV